MENQPSTKVFDLRKEGEEWVAEYSLPPREAVRNAYAQFEKKDFETWNYAKYDKLVFDGVYTVSCGNYAAWKEDFKQQVERTTGEKFDG